METFQSGHPVLVSWVSALDRFHCSCTLIVQFQQASNCSKSTVNTRKRCAICSYLTVKTYQIDVIDIVLVSLLLTLDIFHNFSYSVYCWLGRPHCICFEQISVGKRPKYFEASGFPCCILNNTHFFWNRSRKSKKKKCMMSGKVEMSAKKMVYPEGTFFSWGLWLPSLKTIAYVVDKQSDICRRYLQLQWLCATSVRPQNKPGSIKFKSKVLKQANF